MSEYMFGIHKGPLSKEELKLWEKVATDHDCWVNGGNIPGLGWQYWFCGRNLGSPFNERLRNAVLGDLASRQEALEAGGTRQ